MVVDLESPHDQVRQIKIEVDRIERETSEQNREADDRSALTKKKQRRIKKLRHDIAEIEKDYPDPRNARTTKSTAIKSSMVNTMRRQNAGKDRDVRTLAIRIREAGRLLLAGELEHFEGEDTLLRMVRSYHAEGTTQAENKHGKGKDQDFGEDKDVNRTGDQNANVPHRSEFTRLDHG